MKIMRPSMREFVLGRSMRTGATMAEYGLVLAWAWGAELWIGRRRVFPAER